MCCRLLVCFAAVLLLLLLHAGLTGPSTAIALTVMQPPAAGKTLESRPAYKGMLRSKVPALCPIGALFRWLIVRVLVLKEPLPQPGTQSWHNFFLWPGRSGEGTAH